MHVQDSMSSTAKKKKTKKQKINGLCVAVGAFYNSFPEQL
jgi:hypothetical protein